MKGRAILVLALLLVCSTAAAVDFWPTRGDATYTYVGPLGLREVVYDDSGNRRSYFDTDLDGIWNAKLYEHFVVDEYGDIRVTYQALYYGDSDTPSDVRDYEVGLKYIDFPLTDLKHWKIGGVGTECDEDDGYVAYTRPETVVSVPAGTFEVREIFIYGPSDCLIEMPFFQDGSYMLNRDVGPVVMPWGWELLSVAGEVVEVEQRSWDEIKALYR